MKEIGIPNWLQLKYLGLKLSLQDGTKSISILGKGSDTSGQLDYSHFVVVKVETELGLISKVGNLLQIEAGSLGGIKLLGDSVGAVVELLKKGGGDGQKVNTSEFLDLTDVTERSTHDNGLVTEFFVVVEDVRDTDDTGVFLSGIVTVILSLVEIENTTDERRNQSNVSLGASNSLDKREQESQVAVDALFLELLSSLDTLIGGGNLDENTLTTNALGFVQLDEVTSLLDSSLGVKRVTSINFGGDTARDDSEDLGTEFDQKTIKSNLNLRVDGTTLCLGIVNSSVDESSILGLLRSGQDERRVCGGILGFVFGDRFKISSIGDDNSASGL